MRARVSAVTTLCLALSAAPQGAMAQQARFDTALVRTFTVAALVDAARKGDSIAALSTSNAAAHARLTGVIARLDRAEVMRLPLSLVARPERVTGG